MSTQAKNGATRDGPLASVEMAMRSWPVTAAEKLARKRASPAA